MSSLIQKIKDKTRGRSKSRRSTKQSDDRYSGEFQSSNNNNTRVRRDSESSSVSSESEMSTPSNTAFHVSKGGRNSTDAYGTQRQSTEHAYTDNTPLPQTSSRSMQPQAQQYRDSNTSQQIPDRSSAAYNNRQSSEINQSDGQVGSAVPYPYTVPRRKESLPQNRHERNSRSIDRNGADPRNSNSIDKSRLNQPFNDDKLRVQPAGQPLGTEIDHALESMSINDKRNSQQQINQQGTRNSTIGHESNVHHVTADQAEHLRLPAGFKLGRTEETTIDTKWRPAVTHENIHHQKTEIIREAITRDIHVHHYYTYVQPVRVVEVLPARHYRFDEATGQKVEIAAPAGWEMPSDMRPRVPDTSGIKGTVRHYLVNEQYPNGIEEPAPSYRKPVHGESVQH